jgi:3-methyladenine DNA glycosylase AlkD
MAAKKLAAPTKSATTATAKAPAKASARAKPAVARLSLADVMATLKKAGSEQTKKTYLRHGAAEPMFGVSFATLKGLYQRIRVDHDLALALWETGNFDARNLAYKIADPAKMTEADLDRWARGISARMCGGYVAALAGEGPHSMSRARAWLASSDGAERASGWGLVGNLAMRDETTPDAWFVSRVGEIEKTIRSAPNAERGAMNQALISIGCRNAALRKAACAAAKRIGPVEVDHGDTACETPDAVAYIDKTWARSVSSGFETPAAHERSRPSMRVRC